MNDSALTAMRARKGGLCFVSPARPVRSAEADVMPRAHVRSRHGSPALSALSSLT